MRNLEWLDAHGFEWVRCQRCRFADYSDSGCLDCEPMIETEPGSCLETVGCGCAACIAEMAPDDAAEAAK